MTITGAAGDLTDVSLTLNLSHTFPAGLDILLVAPDDAHNGDYIGLVGFKDAFNTDWIVAV